WGENPKDKAERVRHNAVRSGHYVENGPTEEFERVAAKERRGQLMFHWPLEFPEVMIKRGGLDAFTCNPPFKGGKQLKSTIGENNTEFVRSGYRAVRGSPDLVAYFVLRSHSLLRASGTLGMICTKSIFQGDTREASLDYLYGNKVATELRRVENYKWPGSANVHIGILWFRSELPSNTSGDAQVSAIGHTSSPRGLIANTGCCFQ